MKNLLYMLFLTISLKVGVISAFGSEHESSLLKGMVFIDQTLVHGKVDPLIVDVISGARIAASSQKSIVALESSKAENLLLKTDQEGDIEVYIHLTEKISDAHLRELDTFGVRVELVEEKLRLIQAWVAPERITDVSDLSYVMRIIPPSYTFPHIGSITTEGDAILISEELRAQGFNGANVRVGVISKGVDNIFEAQDTGDLPSVQILSSIPDSGDEGTAMLEIVHDIAPAADLGFCAVNTTLEFIQCIRDLKTLFGADIIIDDLGSFGEPYFEDGPVALEVAQAVNEGVLYASAAGNAANNHYEQNYLRTGASEYALHDFGTAAGLTSDLGMDIKVAPGTVALIFLQWNDPFGKSGNDYDLGLFDDAGLPLAVSARLQDGDDDPYEVVGFINDGTTAVRVEVVVEKHQGQDRRLEMYLWSDYALGLQIDEYKVPSGSIFGHSAVPGALAIGAIDAQDPEHDTIEAFSSQGPAEVFFPIHEIRNKPDLAAIDGVSVSGAGSFPSPFYGTSAAVPHVAGVAALLKSARPSATAAHIITALKSTAVDLGDPGLDFTYGSGRVDALAAESELAAPNITANGLDGPLNIGSSESLSINVRLRSSNHPTLSADWWVFAATPWGDWYYYTYPGKWSNAGTNLKNIGYAYQGPLFNLDSFEVLNIRGLPEGRYDVYFGVDTQPNGFIDQYQYHDTVGFNVTN